MDLKNKTVAFLGDSITESLGTSAPQYRYDSRIAIVNFQFSIVN